MARKPRDLQHVIALLREHADCIKCNGSLVYRNEPGRKPCWCLRFRAKSSDTGKTQQRSIYLGTNHAVAETVGQYLAEQRDKRTAAMRKSRLLARQERENREKERMETKFFADTLCNSHPYSRRAKTKVRRIACRKVDDTNALIRMCLLGQPLRTRRPGRPLKNRLW